MREQNKEALKHTAGGAIAVLAVGLLVNLAAPDTRAGKWLKFIAPLLTGTIAGIWIYWKLGEKIQQEKQA